MKKIIIAILILMTLVTVSCSSNKAKTYEKAVMEIDITSKGKIYNGTSYYTYQVEEGQEGIVTIKVERVSGTIDVDICPVSNPEKSEYKGRGLDSTSFDVILSEKGEYKVTINANNFIGDYGISWRTK